MKSDPTRPRKQRTDLDRDFLRRLVKVVRERLRADEEVSVKAIARHLDYSRQHVSGRFRRLTGRTLGRYLREKRLEKAAQLLSRGEDIRVADLARRCGFHSPNQFRQQFQRRYGMSPRQFRTYSRGLAPHEVPKKHD